MVIKYVIRGGKVTESDRKKTVVVHLPDAMKTSEVGSEREQYAIYKDQSGIEVLVILLDILHVILCCLSLVDGIEIKAGIVALDRRQECAQSILYADSIEHPVT